jgi:hypothetical protein
MQAFSAADLMSLWEQGSGLHPIDQALLVLGSACPEHTRDALASLTLGERDRLLVQVHRQNFGDCLDAYTECPECHERLEFSLSCGLLTKDTTVRDTTKTVTLDGDEFSLRCPNSLDAAASASAENLETAKRILLSRCVTAVNRSELGTDIPPELMQAAIAAELAAIDPRAEMLLDLACPSCGHAWQAVFDILTFLWAKIRARARRLLQEVDALARAYGWTEADILTMAESRRGLYVQMALS